MKHTVNFCLTNTTISVDLFGFPQDADPDELVDAARQELVSEFGSDAVPDWIVATSDGETIEWSMA